ncbi:MAG: polyprenyl synthetase family protein [Natronospirillum sp.]
MPAQEPRLNSALAYAMQSGGKHMRPLLVFAAAQAMGCNDDGWLLPAAAIELIHTYSLVHDDLPAMDNDDWRRGRATTHRTFDEATAILVGDGLQALAFNILSNTPAPDVDERQRLKWIGLLADAAGHQGMVDGQAMDLAAEGKTLSLPELELIHRNKTGKLITAAVLMGAYCQAVPPNQNQIHALNTYASALGLAFQIVDDILDITGDTATLGKDAGSDTDNEKATYVALMGVENARKKAEQLYAEALTALESLPSDTSALKTLADFTLQRNR